MLLEVVGRVGRVEHDRRVEEGEEDDQPGVEQHVERLPVADHRGDRVEPATALRRPEKLASVTGRSSSEDAKIGGMTPEVLSLSGRCEESPWNIRLPTWRFGYWMSSRRWARSTKTMTRDHDDRHHGDEQDQRRSTARLRGRVRACRSGRAAGSATMPEKMISEMPLPMPRLVICSPSHIRNIVPPVSVITVGDAEEHARVGDDVGRRPRGRRRCHRPGAPRG